MTDAKNSEKPATEATLRDDQATEAMCLVDQPQLLGILPTHWFWRDRENWRLVRIPFGAFLMLSTYAFLVWNAPLPVAMLAPGSMFIIALGLLERYIRRRAVSLRESQEEERPALDAGEQ